ncbi:hypothetical protein PHYSODRAFT_494980 [Phytophthora sojae]|uniref:Uncharacterized protein n=1 Tax=Phytophthora sojae (strain P6497) TaxID=1094619 RepID=G4Z4G7_PHYSP|nr:hypothetical protein PHYSODRAFT_494980 [Phytophthora sojae]EGZ20171.1 hypothetical protein PHYSODRAFT_494980 [Phytophthora sojae]|eukprot:XP_009522888.1 hypothetical protein PHYSODRAFT_494980 [Phytophthora sojae]
MFPGLPEGLKFIAEYCLASLTYHHAYMIRAILPKHPVLETPLFPDPALLSSLAERVQSGDGSSEARIRPTGVPPHVSILCEMKWLKENLVGALTASIPRLC